MMSFTFSFPNFLIIGLRNYPANCLFDIISLLIADFSGVTKISDRVRVTASPEDFLSRNMQTFDARLL